MLFKNILFFGRAILLDFHKKLVFLKLHYCLSFSFCLGFCDKLTKGRVYEATDLLEATF